MSSFRGDGGGDVHGGGVDEVVASFENHPLVVFFPGFLFLHINKHMRNVQFRST
jgi:hypothetical protein